MNAKQTIIAFCALFYGHNIHCQSYTDVAVQQNLTFLAESDNFGNGLSFYDFDLDGWDDLSFTMSNDSLEFYRNNNGILERMPSFVFGDGVVKHVLWVDYDNDGDMDLFTTSYQKPYKLYRNDGDFSFTDVSIEAGLAQVNEKHYGASFGDYNRDGFLDLYVCTYEFEGDVSMYNRLNHLYKNNGDGTFSDVTLEAGVEDGITFSFQSVWLDYDKDGWQDLLVINDRLHANSLYHNNTDGTFTNVALAAGVAWPGQDPMSASVGDFDNDGDLDVFHSNTGIVNKHFRLWVNNDDGTFTESALQYGLEIYSWTWGAIWVDYNNNTFQDLYVTSSLPNGALESNFFLVNQEGEFFTNGITNFTGNHFARSFAAARGDLNNDGFYEIAVQNQNPTPPFLWENSGGENNYIKISLQGTVSNRMAIGSWIRVYAGGNCYTQYTHCGENYVSQNSQHHIFGLGTNTIVDSIQIVFPNGHIDNHYNLEVNQSYHFIEGESYNANISTFGEVQFCEGDSVVLNAGNHFQVLWNTGDETTEISIYETGSYWYTATNEFGLTAQSDTIEVLIFPNPNILINQQNPLCFGDANGSANVVNISGSETLQVIWSNGLFGESIDNLSEGIYYFDYVDVNGCSAQGFVQIQEPLELFAQLFPSPDFGNNNGSLLIIINGGTPPYFVYLNGEEYSTSIFDLQFGAYQVLIEDFNLCTFEAEAIIDNLTANDQMIVNNELLLYPNPTSGMLFVDSNYELIKAIRVFDIYGRLVFETTTQKSSFNLSGFSAGCYTIEILHRNSKAYRKILLD